MNPRYLNLVYRFQQALAFILFGLIILGAGVRIADAGLACPDWPLCFGEFIPAFNMEIFLEWIHRVIAMVSGMIALFVSVTVLRNSILRKELWAWVLLSLLLFGFQAWLGRQTVIQLLLAETVASHLMGGYTLFALNLFILYRIGRIRRENSGRMPLEFQRGKSLNFLKWIMPLLCVIIFLQATLGGSVSSNYAGLVCADFPTCNGEWWPGLSGVIGLQFMHRLGAFVLLFAVIIAKIYVLRGVDRDLKLAAYLGGALLLILLQIGFGVSMIFTKLNPGLSLMHSATALGIFTCLILGTIHVCRR